MSSVFLICRVGVMIFHKYSENTMQQFCYTHHGGLKPLDSLMISSQPTELLECGQQPRAAGFDLCGTIQTSTN